MAEGQVTKDVVILELQINETGGVSGKNPAKAKTEVDALATSILGLQQANKKLREERKLVDTATAEGTKKIQELNAVIEKNDEIIKKNSTSLEKQFKNVGNYKSALDGLTPALNKVEASFAAFLNPVTAFLAIGGGLLALYTSSTKGAKDMAKATDLIASSFDIARESVGDFVDEASGGGGLLETLAGSLISYFSPSAAIVAKVYADAKDKLRDLELSTRFAQQFAKDDERKAEAQRRIRDDETKSLSERVAASERVTALLENSGQRTVTVLKAQIEAVKNSTKNYNDNRQAQLEVAGLEAEIADKREEIFGKLTENEKALADLRREHAAEQEIFARNSQANLYADLELKQLALDEERKILGKSKVDIEDNLKAVEKVRKEQHDREVKAYKAKADKIKLASQEETDAKNAALDAGLNFARVAFGRFKAFAIAETIVNTIRGIVRAIADYPFPYSAIVSALVGAAGTIQTARIAGVKFAQGGEIPNRMTKHWTVGGNSHAQGGTKYYGSDGNVIEAERGEGIYVMKRTAEEARQLSNHNVSYGGKSWMPGAYPSMKKYAQGGEIITTNNSTATLSLDRVVNAIADMNIFVKVSEINEVQGIVADKTTQARVIG